MVDCGLVDCGPFTALYNVPFGEAEDSKYLAYISFQFLFFIA